MRKILNNISTFRKGVRHYHYCWRRQMNWLVGFYRVKAEIRRLFTNSRCRYRYWYLWAHFIQGLTARTSLLSVGRRCEIADPSRR